MNSFRSAEDPLDEAGVNLSFVDLPTHDPREAFAHVEEAAESGELWRNLYPDDREHPYSLIKTKMMYLYISASSSELGVDAVVSGRVDRNLSLVAEP